MILSVRSNKRFLHISGARKSTKMIDLTKPYEVKRIRRDDKGNYLMSKSYIHALATAMKKDVSDCRSLNQLDKKMRNRPAIEIYGYVQNKRFYLITSHGNYMRDFLDDHKNVLAQMMLNFENFEYYYLQDLDYHGKSIHPKISDLIENIETSQSAFVHNRVVKRHVYHVLDHNDDEFDGQDFDTVEKAKAYIKKFTCDHHDMYIATERDLVFNPIYDGYVVENEEPYGDDNDVAVVKGSDGHYRISLSYILRHCRN